MLSSCGNCNFKTKLIFREILSNLIIVFVMVIGSTHRKNKCAVSMFSDLEHLLSASLTQCVLFL